LRPDAAITSFILYALAVSARRSGIHVHALCAMSTHLHLVVTDEKGELPRFLQYFHRLVALGTKVLVDQLGGGVVRASRPGVYLDPSNPAWPEEATLEMSLPSVFGEGEADDFRREVAAQLAREEAKAHAELAGEGVLGAERAGSVSPYERATSFEPLRALNPTFAVGHGSKDAWRRAAAAVRAFRADYRAALAQWSKGVRDVLFPAGTWWMRVFHAAGVRSDVPAA
jgi:hypothetical protein